MQIGRKVYYELITGNIILTTSEMQGSVIETTTEQDFFNYAELKERNKETVGVIKLEYGQYAEDFATCNGFRVNKDTKKLEFSYPDPTEPIEPVFQKPLTEQVKELENKLKTADEKYLELDKVNTPLEILRSAKIDQLKQKCTEAIFSGFDTEFGKFGFNEYDQANITQQMVLIIADTQNSIQTIQWKSLDLGVVELTKDQFISLVNSAKQHKLINQTKYWQLEASVLSAVDNTQIDSIVW